MVADKKISFNSGLLLEMISFLQGVLCNEICELAILVGFLISLLQARPSHESCLLSDVESPSNWLIS